MNKRDLLTDLQSRIFDKIIELNASMMSLWELIPMTESVRRESKLWCSPFGELLVYYKGVGYSFEIIEDIVEKKGELKEEYLYDMEIN